MWHRRAPATFLARTRWESALPANRSSSVTRGAIAAPTRAARPAVTLAERLRIVELLVDEAAGKTPILAGAGGYNTREVIHLAGEMKKVGASGLLSVTPYYNKPTQEGLFQHYRAIAESTTLPIVVYN